MNRPSSSISRGLLSAILFLLPTALGVVLLEVTSSPRDANIGGGMFLMAAIGVGALWAARCYSRRLEWRALLIGLASLAAVAFFTFGSDWWEGASRFARVLSSKRA